jgi:hypothetical protein
MQFPLLRFTHIVLYLIYAFCARAGEIFLQHPSLSPRIACQSLITKIVLRNAQILLQYAKYAIELLMNIIEKRRNEPFRIPPNGVGHSRYTTQTTERGWQPTCHCNAGVVPCIVFDPFCGSGTTMLVARALGRHGIGTDLSWPYLHNQAYRRLGLHELARWEGTAKPVAEDYSDLPLLVGRTL